MTIEKLVKILSSHGILFDAMGDRIIAHDAWIPETKQNIDTVLTVSNNVLYVNGNAMNVWDYLGY